MKTKKNRKIIATMFAVVFSALWVNAQTVQWTNHYQTTGQSDENADVHIGGDGRIYVCGNTQISGADFEARINSYSITGTQNWVQTCAGSASGADHFSCVTSYGTGSSIVIYAAGYALMSGGSGWDMLLAK